MYLSVESVKPTRQDRMLVEVFIRVFRICVLRSKSTSLYFAFEVFVFPFTRPFSVDFFLTTLSLENCSKLYHGLKYLLCICLNKQKMYVIAFLVPLDIISYLATTFRSYRVSLRLWSDYVNSNSCIHLYFLYTTLLFFFVFFLHF
jgi:hypothetical protein